MWLVVRLAVVALVAGCVRGDSGAPDTGAAGSTGSVGFTVSNRDVGPPIPPPPTVASDEVEFPDPPEVACATDTGGVDAGGCAFPQPVCGRIACDVGNCGPQANGWIAYHTNARCVDNRCRWDRRFTWCREGCRSGGCISRPTIP